MVSKVTERFIECLNALKENKQVPSDRQFAIALDFHAQSLNDIRKGKRNATVELIHKSIEVFDFNPDYLFRGEGSPICTDVEIIPETDKILTVVTDFEKREKIVYVPIAAQAGYGGHLHNPTFFQELTSFSLPDQQFQSRTQRCFDVSGDSMEPSIQSGDKIICSFVEKETWITNVRSNLVYIVVTKEEILVKRLINNLSDSQEFILQSDNMDYPDIVLHGDDVLEIWIVKTKLSSFRHDKCNQQAGLYKNMEAMQKTIHEQCDLITNLNSTIEKLLKKNRVLA